MFKLISLKSFLAHQNLESNPLTEIRKTFVRLDFKLSV